MKRFPAAFQADLATAIQQRSRRCKDVVSYPIPQSDWRASANELRRQQIAQSRQVVRGEIEQPMRANLVQATRHQTAQRPDILHLAEGLLDHLSTTQTDRVAFGGLDVLGHGAALGLGRHVWGNAQCRQGAHEVGGVVTPIRCHSWLAGLARRFDAALDHHQRGLTFSGPGGWGRVHIDDQPVPVLGQGMRGVAQKRHAATLARQPRLGVGARNVRRVRALLAPEVDLGIAALVRSGRLIRAVARGQALVRGPRPQQRAVDAEVLIGHQLGPLGDRHHAAEELALHALLEQAIAVGRERGVIPDRLVQRQAHEPSVHHVEIDMLDKRTLRADRKQALQQRGEQQTLRRNRGASAFGIERIELRRHRAQNQIGKHLHAAQRVVSRNSILEIDVAEQGALFMIGAPHRNNGSGNADRIVTSGETLPLLASD